jgi:rare lipoprotein A
MRKYFNSINVIFFFIMLVIACSSTGQGRTGTNELGSSRETLRKDRSQIQGSRTLYGKASYYAEKYHGRKTASGETFDMNALTAAHRTLPFGTICKVTNLSNQKTVNVKINDRGPFIEGRIIDLSKGAAKALDAMQSGVIEVKIEILHLPAE